MLLPEIKEREYRFKLALRIGLPIFAMVTAFIFHTFINSHQNLEPSFFVEATLLLVVSIYFTLYLIYSGFSVKITDDISKTFSREYIFEYLKKELSGKKEYTLILISIENLTDINKLYGIKNGDKILYETAQWIGEYFKKEGIENFPLGHIKGGEFLIGVDGGKERYTTLLELLLLRSNEMKIDDIEVKLSGAIIDTSYSHELDYLLEKLFELLERKRNLQNDDILCEFNPNELEVEVIKAIRERRAFLGYQKVFDKDKKELFNELFVRLKSSKNKPLYPKTYIKLLNRLKLGVSFDTMLIEEIVHNAPRGMSIAVSIFPTSLRNEKFLTKLKELLPVEDLRIMFVLSEMEYYSHIERYNVILSSLKHLGIKIVIDRVASQHTSFLYMRELDIDMIRFDTYYSCYEKLLKNREIIFGFVTMAHEKGLECWMKNIEDEETYMLAKDLGIDFLQGKYLSQLESKNEIR